MSVKAREINSSQFAFHECWLIQAHGLNECDNCDYKDTDECGGKNIRLTGKNNKGHEVPLGREVKTK